jgi:succinate dehydrogenase / fumarate reductase cytochrome b subunit
MTDKAEGKIERPLSPHLQIYKPQMTSVLSILHRATGMALVFGIVMVVWMLVSAAMGPEAYSVFRWFVNSWVGQLMLFGWSFCLFYHMSNGVRHLIWDTGRLFKMEHAYIGGYLVLASAFTMTFLLWWFACPYTGGS